MLKVIGIDTYYGSSHILFDVSLTVKEGEIVGLLGRNGAGKSTTMKSIMGLTPPKKGEVIFKGKNITGEKPFLLARMGIGYIPDDRRVFADLTVDDNLEIPFKRDNKWSKERVYELFPALGKIKERRAGNLSGGEQQMLTIGRALINSPQLLLLDEPTEGLAPMIVRNLEEQIIKLKETGISILLSEQNLKSSLNLIDRAYIIDNGRICYQGSVKALSENQEIKKTHIMV